MYESAGPVQAVMIVDSRAGTEQRLALQSCAKHMAGDLLQDVVRVDYQPVDLNLIEGDQICHNEEAWYRPLTKLDHAMQAYAVANQFSGAGLGTTWSSPDKRSSFVGTFVTESE